MNLFQDRRDFVSDRHGVQVPYHLLLDELEDEEIMDLYAFGFGFGSETTAIPPVESYSNNGLPNEESSMLVEILQSVRTLIGRAMKSIKFVLVNLQSETEILNQNQKEVESGNGMCAICIDEFNEGQEVKQLPCLHIYHGECILAWLQIKKTCPVCRLKLPAG